MWDGSLVVRAFIVVDDPPVADRNVLCKAGEQAGGPDRRSPAPLFKRFLQALMLFGYRALAELDGSLRLG